MINKYNRKTLKGNRDKQKLTHDETNVFILFSNFSRAWTCLIKYF
jgi:hypothetical protein